MMFSTFLLAVSLAWVAPPPTAAAPEPVSGVDAAAAPETISFLNDVLPILTRAGCNSGACHGALAGKGGLKLSLRGYDPEADHHALTLQNQGRRIDLEAPAESLMVQKGTGTLKHGGGQRLEPDDPDLERLLAWLRGGAPGPRPDEARLVRLEIQPAAATAQVDDNVTLRVLAHYSQGPTRDVTRWAKFTSTADDVAVVGEDGVARITGHGEAAVAVWFNNLVSVATLTAPHRHAPLDPASLGRNNFIDDHINAKLVELRLPPSPTCSDREFIRRVYLDATGTLPRPEQVADFLADPRSDKRARLIDDLLASPEFVDAWTHKLGDLFLVSSARLPQPAVWAFHHYLRRSVAENKPWDRLAREVLTAQGSNLEQGQGNYFVLHQEVAGLAETTAVTFLGMSLTCAKCHNHPLEKWTQDQYWGFTNLFSRVNLKAGDRSGEVWVGHRPSGDVMHPRRAPPPPPTPLDAQSLDLNDPTDRRIAFADWLTAENNPYFAKAMVNRVWKSYMGRGLIEAEDDLRLTNPPSHPALLAALEADFRAQGYDLRRLMRLIMNSAAYQRSSTSLPESVSDDRFYSRYLPRRLSAEVILDAYSQITGVPTPFNEVHAGNTGGLSQTQDYPLGTRALQLPDTKVVSRFLDSFGRPERELACACERDQDSSVRQALHLNNGQTLNEKLRDAKAVTARWAAETVSDADLVTRLFELALARPPSAEELARFTAHMAEAPDVSRRELIEDVVWAVLTSREFLFNH